MAQDRRKRKDIKKALRSPELSRTGGGALALVAADEPQRVLSLTPAGLSTTTGKRVVSAEAARELAKKHRGDGPIKVKAIDAFRAENATRRGRSSSSRTVRS